MNSQYENVIFTAYFILWGISGLLFFALSKKAKSIEKKKMIDAIGFMVIAALILGVVILLKLPVLGVGLVIIGLGASFYVSQKYTSYCPHCLKKTQHLFSTFVFCPKCGNNIERKTNHN